MDKMREIKFRAWDKINGGKMMYHESIANCSLDELAGFTHQGHLVFQQFTGLKDKNGAEIYEGDITRITIRNMVVDVWSEVKFYRGAFIVSLNDKNDMPNLGDMLENYMGIKAEIEVAGNIYENPELIKKGDNHVPTETGS